MEQEEDKSPMSPFWLPKTNNHRRLRRSYSIFLTSTSFLVLLFITALVLALVVVPTLRSFTSIIFKPQTVKHSWDYLNLCLVLFAVVCGFLTKNDTNETQTQTQTHTPRFERSFSNPDTPPSWYQNSSRSFNRLRSGGSYPDLRQPALLVADEERYRFYDDTHIHLRHRFFEAEDEVYPETVTSGEVCLSPMRLPEMKPVMDSRNEPVRGNAERVYEVETIVKPEMNYSFTENSLPPPLRQPLPAERKKKTRSASTENVATVTYEEFSSPPPLQQLQKVRKKKTRSASTENAATVTYEEFSSPVLEPELNPHPVPPMTRTKPVRRNVNRTYQSEMIDKFERSDFVAESSQPPAAVAPPLMEERKIGIPVKKKRGNATKEFLTSLRGKKQRQKSVENFETIQNSQPSLHVSLPPQPPPPPPPPSVFQNMFYSRKIKHKKHYLVPAAAYKPQLPNKGEYSNYRLEKNVVITGNESPSIPIPPPPPPPPFKLPAWKFRVQGDYVRVDSIGSSRSGSPDSDENVEWPISRDESSQCSNSPYVQDGEENVSEIGNASEASLFCPSPDVDTKAHNFIKNFRAGLRMAKMNSMKEKQGIGRSNLGPIQN